jgi:hypothetical protein
VEAVSVTINGAVSPRQPSARGTAVAALANVVGLFTVTVALWAGVTGAVPLWAGAVTALAGIPAAAFDQRSTRTTSTTISTMSSSSIPDVYPP